MNDEMERAGESRRDFLKKLAYMPPAIASLTVLPAFHASGSGLTRPGGENTKPGKPPKPGKEPSWGRPWKERGRDRD